MGCRGQTFHLSHFDGGTHLRLSELLDAGHIAFGHDAAAGTDLDAVHMVAGNIPGQPAHLIGGVRHAAEGEIFAPQMGRQVQVAMTAGGADRPARYLHAGAPGLAAVDGIADGYIRIEGAAHIPQGGKASQQILLGIDEAADHAVAGVVLQIGHGFKGSVQMGVDQTRCDKPVRTVHDLIALGDFNGFPAFHRLDAVVLHQDHLIGIHPLFYCVEQFSTEYRLLHGDSSPSVWSCGSRGQSSAQYGMNAHFV